MSFTCTNWPASALNARIEKTGNIADYYCQTGFSMTSGTGRATCVGTNTWEPSTPPTCTVIDTTTENVVPLWVPIVCAALIGFILIVCIILLIYYCCCGPGKCCGDGNRTSPHDHEHYGDGYYDDKQYINKGYHSNGNGYYYGDNNYKRGYEGTFIVPVDFKQPGKSDQDVVNLVKLTDGQFIPLEKYLQQHPEAKLATMGDRDVVYLPEKIAEVKPQPKQAWRANNKRTPPRPVVKSNDTNANKPTIVSFTNDLTEDQPTREKTQTVQKRTPPTATLPPKQQQHPNKPPPTKIIVTPVGSKPGTKEKKRRDDIPAEDDQVLQDQGNDDVNRKDLSIDSEFYASTPPANTVANFKRHAFTVRDLNRFRPAKDFPAWRPHTKPIRDNNTSTQ